MSCVLNWFGAHREALAGLASVFSILGTIIAASIFFFGLRQYVRAENWKRTEFLAKLYSQFSNDPASHRAMWMLDGDDRTIYFDEGDKQEPYPVDQDVFHDALRDFSTEEKFTQLELHIRDNLDRFFIYLEQFDRAIENRLVDESEVYPYFGYWIDLLNKPRERQKDEVDRQRVLHYIDECDFDHVKRFLGRWVDDASE